MKHETPCQIVKSLICCRTGILFFIVVIVPRPFIVHGRETLWNFKVDYKDHSYVLDLNQ